MAPLSPSRLGGSLFPLLARLQLRCIAIYGNDNFDRQPICLQTARRLVDGRPPPPSGISLLSHFLPPTLGGFLFLLHSSRWAGASVRWKWGVGKMDLIWGRFFFFVHQWCRSGGTSRCARHLPVAPQSFCLHLKCVTFHPARSDFNLACTSQRFSP